MIIFGYIIDVTMLLGERILASSQRPGHSFPGTIRNTIAMLKFVINIISKYFDFNYSPMNSC